MKRHSVCLSGGLKLNVFIVNKLLYFRFLSGFSLIQNIFLLSEIFPYVVHIILHFVELYFLFHFSITVVYLHLRTVAT